MCPLDRTNGYQDNWLSFIPGCVLESVSGRD